jgi:hypothetical protein
LGTLAGGIANFFSPPGPVNYSIPVRDPRTSFNYNDLTDVYGTPPGQTYSPDNAYDYGPTYDNTFGISVGDNTNPGSDPSYGGGNFGDSVSDNSNPGATDSGPSTSDTGNTAGAGGGESEARGGLNANGRYYPPKYAQGGIASLAPGGLGSLGGYSDGGRLLRGPGDGVSDSIPATIGRKRPARLADGEFVVPARIVSELGNGSTEAGARQLYAMMDRIQAGRKKTVGKNKTAVNSKSVRHLPA